MLRRLQSTPQVRGGNHYNVSRARERTPFILRPVPLMECIIPLPPPNNDNLLGATTHKSSPRENDHTGGGRGARF